MPINNRQVDKKVKMQSMIPQSIHENLLEEMDWNRKNNGGFDTFARVLCKRLKQAPMWQDPDKKK